jgi:hypothetical protein
MKPGLHYIHGPADEIKDRAKGVRPAPYFNPLVMTEGEAYLLLMRDQANVLAQYFPENPVFPKGVSMIDNALYRGIRGYTPAMGAVDPKLYPVARAIDVYKLRRQPAVKPAGIGSWENQSLIAGDTDAIPEIPEKEQDFAKWWWSVDFKTLSAKYKSFEDFKRAVGFAMVLKFTYMDEATINRFKEMRQQFAAQDFIIKKFNESLENFGHHPLYNFLPKTSQYPSAVITKNILHAAGMQNMANVGMFSTTNMEMWTRNAILRKNIAGGAGAISPEMTAFALTGLPEGEFSQFLGTPSNRMREGTARVGLAVELTIAIVGLIASAIGGAFEFMKSVEQKKAAAFASVQGWGTAAYAANENDFEGYGLEKQKQQGPDPDQDTKPSNLPLILGGGAALWLLTQK